MKQKRTCKSIYLILLIILPLLSISMYSTTVNAQVTTDAEPIYLVSGDLIKNFKFETINGKSIDAGGGAYDNRLKFEIEPLWTMSQSDVELVYSQKVGDKIYFYYKIALKNKLNIYTNVRLNDACETIERESRDYLAAAYLHYPTGSSSYDGQSWRRDLTYHCYNFWEKSSLREYNKRNTFGGTLDMSFDIDDSPLPATLTDSKGNTLVKQFDYIGVSSAAVLSSDHGSLSNAPPEIHVSTPEYKTEERADVSGDNPSGSMASKTSYDTGYRSDYSFNTEARIQSAGYETYDPGIQAPSDDSSMNPTQKNGAPIYDNTMESEASQKDCRIHYNLGAIAPVVTEYYSRLDWTSHVVKCHDKRIQLSALMGITYHEWKYEEESYSKVKSSALHVSNRYIQSELQIVLNIWTSYQIQVVDSPEFEDYDMEQPVEYYDNVTWQTASDGYVEGEYTQETDSPLDDFFDAFTTDNQGGEWAQNAQNILILIIILIVIIAIVIVIVRYARPRPKVYYEGRVVR